MSEDRWSHIDSGMHELLRNGTCIVCPRCGGHGVSGRRGEEPDCCSQCGGLCVISRRPDPEPGPQLALPLALNRRGRRGARHAAS